MSSPPLLLRHEFVRKGLHTGAVAFPAAYALGASRNTLGWILGAMTAVAFLIEGLRRTNADIAARFRTAFGSLMRRHETGAITGATWLALSCFAAVMLLSRSAAIAALWCATVADPAATIAGRLWAAGRVRPAEETGRKTLAGSFAFVTASFAGIWMVAGYAPILAVVVAAAATVAEAMPVRLDDNIRVACAAGVIAQLLVVPPGA